MSNSAPSPGRHRNDHRKRRTTRAERRPLARVFLRTAGMAALLAWAVILCWASFGNDASTGSSGPNMIVGTVASVLLVAVVLLTAATRTGPRLIIAALVAAVLAAAGGWLVFASMPDAGPDAYITHRAGIAALAYGFGVIGGGLLALSEFVVEGYAGGRVEVPKAMRRKVAVFATAVIVLAAAALAPAMQRWAELANQDLRTGDAAETDAGPGFDEMTSLAGVQRFVETPYGMLRLDHPDSPSPQAYTLLDPAGGDPIWYHRRWNWQNAQPPVLSQARDLVAITGPRSDNLDDFQTRVLHTRTGEIAATAAFDGSPGELLAVADNRLLYAAERDGSLTAFDFAGQTRWHSELPPGCQGAAAQITGQRLVILADCVPAPDRPIARDYVLAFDLEDGAESWQREVDRRANVVPESFLVTEDTVIIDSRIELRVTDGPFSARRFEHKILAFDAQTGEMLWRNKEQVFGSTHSSACGGTLYLSQSPATEVVTAPETGKDEAEGDGGVPKASVASGSGRTVQLVECYTAGDREGSWLGVMAYDLDSGERLFRKSVKLGFTPLDPEVARGWAAVLPDNRALLATDLSLDPTQPDCKLFQVHNGESSRLDVTHEDLPAAWCQDAQLTTVAGGVAISYVNGDGTRDVVLVS